MAKFMQKSIVILLFSAAPFLMGIGIIGSAIMDTNYLFVRILQGMLGLLFAAGGVFVFCFLMGWIPESWGIRSVTRATDTDPVMLQHRINASLPMHGTGSDYGAPAAPACDTSPPSFSGADSCSVGPSSSSDS